MRRFGVSDRKLRSRRRIPEGPSPRRGCRGQPKNGHRAPLALVYWLNLRDIICTLYTAGI